jgi:hypothetical protein
MPAKVHDSQICFFDSHLFPEGDLLVVFHGFELDPLGYGLCKLDKSSRVVWTYSQNVHHDVDVGDDGTIYAIEQHVAAEVPVGMKELPTPALLDSIVLLSPEGKLLQKIPILEAFRRSPFALLVSRAAGDAAAPRTRAPGDKAADVFHTNAVKVLRKELATRFQQFKPGQILISIRELDTIAVIDPDSAAVVWAATGPWRGQHDVQFLDNGHLLLFDNLGAPWSSRVLEYDPRTQAFPWVYPGKDDGAFVSRTRGMCQRLPNGNTLIVNSDKDQVFEVTEGRELVWSLTGGGEFMHLARRYGPGYLRFLPAGTTSRPSS